MPLVVCHVLLIISLQVLWHLSEPTVERTMVGWSSCVLGSALKVAPYHVHKPDKFCVLNKLALNLVSWTVCLCSFEV